jgi:hypothetical protein
MRESFIADPCSFSILLPNRVSGTGMGASCGAKKCFLYSDFPLEGGFLRLGGRCAMFFEKWRDKEMMQAITFSFAEQASLTEINSGVAELRNFFREQALPVTISEGSICAGHPVVKLDIGQRAPREGWKAKLSIRDEPVEPRAIDATLTLYKHQGIPVVGYAWK